MPKFTTLPVEVEAYQVPPNGDMTPEAYKWLREIRPMGGVAIFLNPGDWLVYRGGALEIFEDGPFHAQFRRVD